MADIRGIIAAVTQVAGVPINLSSGIRLVNVYGAPIYAMLNRVPAEARYVTWTVDDANALVGAQRIKFAGSAGAVTLSVTAASHAYFMPNDVIKLDSELLRVTAVSSTNLTVTRGYGGTTRTTHDTTTVVTIVTRSAVEGAAGTAHATLKRVSTNQCQIIDKIIEVTGTMRAVRNVDGEEFNYQVRKDIEELGRLAERAILHGYLTAASTNAAARSMKGIVTALSTNRFTTNTSLTTTRLAACFSTAFINGANPTVCVVDPTMWNVLAKLQLSKTVFTDFRPDWASGAVLKIVKWMSPFGIMDLVLDRQLGLPLGLTGCMLGLDWEEIKLAVLRAEQLEAYAKVADTDKAKLLLEGCVKWGNEKHHLFISRKF
ncbi:MAG TPA: DUF5309 family protein [Planctomycetota bacterium]|nr:DUF5309 family protein [Planctomycetota bacterium]